MKNPCKLVWIVLGAGLWTCGLAQADTYHIVFPLEGAQQTPPVVTAGSGVGVIDYDDVSNLLEWNISYQNLSAPTIAAHIHGPALPGEEAGPVIDFSDFGSLDSPLVGSTTISDPQEADLLGGLWYANVHTEMEENGEIRGQIVNTCISRCGDNDCDGDVDAFDISAFVLNLTDPPTYCSTFAGCDRYCAGDTDGDADIDAFDISGFVAALTAGNCLGSPTPLGCP